jgi:hypothetical protein
LSEATGKRKPAGFSFKMFIPLAFLGCLVGVFVYSWRATSEVGELAERYLAYVREGQLDDAYALVHPKRRAGLNRSAFEQQMSTPELREATTLSWQATDGPDSFGRACVIGHIDVPAGNRGIRIYLQETADGYRVLDVLLYDGRVPKGPFSCGGV